MICERFDLQVDVDKLRDHLIQKVLPLPPEMQAAHFGGWSVLSSNGDYRDGWVSGSSCYKIVGNTVVLDEERIQSLNIKKTSSYYRPTQICNGYLESIMRKIAALGLNPRRARITMLLPNTQSILHRDASDNTYAVRLHIPIITNPQCTFVCEEGEAHLPADGSAFFLRVNRLHQIFNRSNERRYHLIMDVVDNAKVSQYHRYPDCN